MYRKDLYVFRDGKPYAATVRNYREADFAALIEIQKASFPPPFPQELLWNEAQLSSHLAHFPEGAVCIDVEGRVAGSITSLRTHFDPEHPAHTWEEVTDAGSIGTHQPDGKTIYVVDVCIHPDFRGMELGRQLQYALYDLVVESGADRLLGGGRLPGYHQHAGELSPEAYVEGVLAGELKDPVISFLLRSGRTPVALVKDYLEDEESHDYGLLMEWRNPFRHVQE